MPFWQILNLHPFSRIARNADDGGAGGAGDGFDPASLPSTLPASLDSLDGLPDWAQPNYVKDGERFAYKGFSAMASANQRLKSERDGIKAELDGLSGFKDFEKTPDEMREIIEAAANAGKTPTDDEIERMKESIKTGADKRVTAVEKERDTERAGRETAEATLQKYMIQTEVAMNLAADKLNGDAELIMPHVQPFIRMQDGKPAVFDTNGDQRFNGKGEPMTPHDLLAEMRDSDRYGRLFNASGAGGGGASSNTASGGGKTMKRAAFEGLSPGEKSSRMAAGYVLVD